MDALDSQQVSVMQVITLTTDFGRSDWFVAAMKGVMLSLNRRATVVDVTHEIPPGDIRAGAFALMASYRCFPKGTVHVAVVDPGVGSERRAIAAQTDKHIFVGPDNGVLSWALARARIKTIRQLENRKYFVEPISQTFHGRDIFAPVAAHISRGLSLARLGRELKDFIRLPWPKVRKHREEVHGEIVYIDRFGNAITNIEAQFAKSTAKAFEVIIPTKKIHCPLAAFYAAVPARRSLAVIGSSDLLEIAVNGGSAARHFGLEAGIEVILRLATAR